MRVLLGHGDGGTLTQQLVQDVFWRAFANTELTAGGDAVLLQWPVETSGQLAVTTDGYVIEPLEFPGGDIGKLAICGTVNDLAVTGAAPQYITAAFILEEGLELARLKRIVASMAAAAVEAGVRIVAGDTKVVERGKGDGVFITTTGVGFVAEPGRIDISRIQPGDRVLVSGGLAEHAVAVLSERAGIQFAAAVMSDCRPLNKMIAELLARFATVRFMRDPTRGGLATVLKEVAVQRGVDITVDEVLLPVRPDVRGALELLGMEPYYLANEGKVVIVAGADEAGEIVRFLRTFPGQKLAADIGVVREGNGQVWLRTPYGGTRNIGLLAGAPLPRIC